ncbi:hypothetical protein TPY_3130 [Sulfobacillus acidophilus TPY]|uniref:Uncharacterized protein n=1 Tax=Sulfobacillus acidophilus (strain ATCC 700253 / DSM 10332 / NAL) TaxID=679936 RepID=G8U001_SULAD|nr:hypothetical protein TPY_3130 [Sulfobacillus acidophilus TPY]AEW04170.1 hypothetical protein Sulac_0657 [Sulfobacillus acidophilus DSM 10332]
MHHNVIRLAAVRRARARRAWTAEDVREHRVVLAMWVVVGLVVAVTWAHGAGVPGLVPGL